MIHAFRRWWRRNVTATFCQHTHVCFSQGRHGETFCQCQGCDAFLHRAMTDAEREAVRKSADDEEEAESARTALGPMPPMIPDDYYPGCAMPVGHKAAFWRQYWEVNLRERIQPRSLLDEVLQELARCEERVLLLQGYIRVTMVEPGEPPRWRPRQRGQYLAAREVLRRTGHATLPQFEEEEGKESGDENRL